MTYNGIGIATPRGTGTSGYVQRALGSLSHERATWEERKAQQSRAAFGGDAAQMVRHVDPGVIEHERKRAVEVRLTDWADEQGLFDKPMDEMERELILAKQRAIFFAEHDARTPKLSASLSAAQDKAREDARLQEAFRMPQGFVPGGSFSKDYQEQQKTQRRENWEDAQQRIKQRQELQQRPGGGHAQQQKQQQQQQQQQQQHGQNQWGAPPPAKVAVAKDDKKEVKKDKKEDKKDKKADKKSKSKESSSKKSRRKTPSSSSSSSSASSSSDSDSGSYSSSSSDSRDRHSRSLVRRRSRSRSRSPKKSSKKK